MPTFEFEFHPRYRPLLLPIGVHSGNSYVAITDNDELQVKFGRWRVLTPIANIVGFERSGDYKWYRAIGLRGSFKDGGVTFGTTTRHGLCTKFAEKIPMVFPGARGHRGMTVTVADVDGLATELLAGGIEEHVP